MEPAYATAHAARQKPVRLPGAILAASASISFIGLLLSLSPAIACDDGWHSQCVIYRPWGGCAQSACVPDVVPEVTPPSVVPTPATPPIPLPKWAQDQVDKFGAGVTKAVEKFGNDTVTVFRKAGGDTIRTLQKAGGDTWVTIQKAGQDTITTVYKGASDITATYVKGWKDVGDQAKRSFNDAVDAGKAIANFTANQAKAQIDAARSAEKRLKDGKAIDAMWGLGVEPLQSSEANFYKATTESAVVNAAAGTAAAIYGGPGGAAAYAAWQTYRQTGNAEMALRAGILAGVTSQMGSSVAKMPTGTTGEILKKAAMAGAAGGIATAAAGGDEQAIKDGFLKSAGAVLVQGGSDKLKAYSPQAKDAFDTVQCISARDVDCLSRTTWARDAKGKILYDKDGKPRIDTTKIDPNNYVGKWTQYDLNSAEGKANAIVAQTSKLPESNIIPIMKGNWVLTYSLQNRQGIKYGEPTVVLTYVGKQRPFVSTNTYARADPPVQNEPSPRKQRGGTTARGGNVDPSKWRW